MRVGGKFLLVPSSQVRRSCCPSASENIAERDWRVLGGTWLCPLEFEKYRHQHLPLLWKILKERGQLELFMKVKRKQSPDVGRLPFQQPLWKSAGSDLSWESPALLGQSNPSTSYPLGAGAARRWNLSPRDCLAHEQCSTRVPARAGSQDNLRQKEKATFGHLPGREHFHLIPAALASNITLCPLPLIFPPLTTTKEGKEAAERKLEKRQQVRWESKVWPLCRLAQWGRATWDRKENPLKFWFSLDCLFEPWKWRVFTLETCLKTTRICSWYHPVKGGWQSGFWRKAMKKNKATFWSNLFNKLKNLEAKY